MIDKNLMKLGYAMSNLGLQQEIDDEIRAKHPNWNDEKVLKERQKQQKKMTIFNTKNKKSKKPKKPKKDK